MAGTLSEAHWSYGAIFLIFIWCLMKGLPLAMYRWLGRTADQLRVGHVVLTFELVLHGRLSTVQQSYRAVATWPVVVPSFEKSNSILRKG